MAWYAKALPALGSLGYLGYLAAKSRMGGEQNAARAAMYPRVTGRGYITRAPYRTWRGKRYRMKAMYGRVSGPEWKFMDRYDPQTPLSSVTPALLCCNDMGSGSGPAQREGRVIEMRSLHIRLVLRSVASSGSCVVRMVVFIDKGANGTTPSFTDVFDTSTITGYLNAMRNLKYRERFVIIKDECVTVSGDGTEGDKGLINAYLPLRYKTIYSDDNATYASIMAGTLWVMLYAGQASSVNTTLATRIRFTDI